MLDFLFEMRLPRVVFGLNTMTRLKAEIEKLGCGAALVLATPRAARIFAGETCGRELPLVGTYENAQMHTPVEVTERALAFLASVKADGLISFGGGSAIGLGKALALRTRLPHLAIPTTYSGSEMTSVVGETSEGRKRTTNDASILPKTVIYDVSQTFALPAPASVTSAMNAIAHGVEAMYAENGSPFVSAIAEIGVQSLVSAVPDLVRDPNDHESRSRALYGAWLCGMCLSAAGMSLHHKLCHELGGTFGLPHAETHTIILPHAISYNADAVPEAFGRMQQAVGSSRPQDRLFDLATVDGVPRSLRELGMPREGIETTIKAVLREPYWSPRPLEAEPLRQLLSHAWEGARPS